MRTRQKDETGRYPKGFLCPQLLFSKAVSNGAEGLNYKPPRRRPKSPGGKTGQETLQNHNREKQVSPLNRRRTGKELALSVHFAPQGRAGQGHGRSLPCLLHSRRGCAGGATCSASRKHASSIAESRLSKPTAL